ncbi:MAG: hypothetical protein ACM3H8_13245 [Sphingobacteriales bacterium]
MKKAIVPPTLLTVAHSVPLKIIATKSSATVIKESNAAFWSATKIFSINNKTKEIKLNFPDSILPTEPEWYSNYE